MALTKRRTETRRRLLDAALDVFAARGFGRATVEDVCAAAGYSRGAFYSNFESLDELFFALYERRAGELVAAVGRAAVTAGGGTSAAESAAGKTATGKTAAGETAAGETAAGETAAGETAAGETAAGETSAEGGDSPAMEPVADVARRVLDALGSDQRWFVVSTEFLVHALRRPEVASTLAAHRAALRRALAPALAAAARGALPASTSAELLARSLVAVHEGSTNQLMLEPDEASLRTWQLDLILAVLDPTPRARSAPPAAP